MKTGIKMMPVEIDEISAAVSTLFATREKDAVITEGDMQIITIAILTSWGAIENEPISIQTMYNQSSLQESASKLRDYCYNYKAKGVADKTFRRKSAANARSFAIMMQAIIDAEDTQARRDFSKAWTDVVNTLIQESATMAYSSATNPEIFGETLPYQMYAILHLTKLYLEGDYVNTKNTVKMGHLLQRLISYNKTESLLCAQQHGGMYKLRMRGMTEAFLKPNASVVTLHNRIALFKQVLLSFEQPYRDHLKASADMQIKAHASSTAKMCKSDDQRLFEKALHECCECKETLPEASMSSKDMAGSGAQALNDTDASKKNSSLKPHIKKESPNTIESKLANGCGIEHDLQEDTIDAQAETDQSPDKDVTTKFLGNAEGEVKICKESTDHFDQQNAAAEQIKILLAEKGKLQEEKVALQCELAQSQNKATQAKDNLQESQEQKKELQVKLLKSKCELSVVNRKNASLCVTHDKLEKERAVFARVKAESDVCLSKKKAHNVQLSKQLEAAFVERNTMSACSKELLARATTAEESLHKKQQAQDPKHAGSYRSKRVVEDLIQHAKDKLSRTKADICNLINNTAKKNNITGMRYKIFDVGSYHPLLKWAEYCLLIGDTDQAYNVVIRLLVTTDIDLHVQFIDEGEPEDIVRLIYKVATYAQVQLTSRSDSMSGWTFEERKPVRCEADVKENNYVGMKWSKKVEGEKYEVDLVLHGYGSAYDLQRLDPISDEAHDLLHQECELTDWYQKCEMQHGDRQINSFPLQQSVFELVECPRKQLSSVRKYLLHILKLVATNSITQQAIKNVFLQLKKLTSAQPDVNHCYSKAINYINILLTTQNTVVGLYHLKILCLAIGVTDQEIYLTEHEKICQRIKEEKMRQESADKCVLHQTLSIVQQRPKQNHAGYDTDEPSSRKNVMFG